MKYFFDALDMTFHRSLLYKEVDAKGEILQHPTAMAEAYALGKESVQKMAEFEMPNAKYKMNKDTQ
jgi:hypothetical protein